MAEQVCDRHLGLQHSQGTLSRCQNLDDGPLHHAVAQPSGDWRRDDMPIRPGGPLKWPVLQGVEDGLQAQRWV
jgi:hypothetical protein